MTNLPPDPSPDDDVPTPRWVKVFGIAFVLLVIVIIILHLTGRGFGVHA